MKIAQKYIKIGSCTCLNYIEAVNPLSSEDFGFNNLNAYFLSFVAGLDREYLFETNVTAARN